MLLQVHFAIALGPLRDFPYLDQELHPVLGVNLEDHHLTKEEDLNQVTEVDLLLLLEGEVSQEQLLMANPGMMEVLNLGMKG
jgi:hypothetical protein